MAKNRPYNEVLGERVRLIREACGMTQQQLAEKTNMHRPNISRLESGKHTPTLDVLRRVCAALQCDMWEVIP